MYRTQNRERRLPGKSHTKRHVPAVSRQDNEEERGSNLRRELSRAVRARTQRANMRVTAKQRRCDRKSRQIVCVFVLPIIRNQEESSICVEL